jgi:hypothetical protein
MVCILVTKEHTLSAQKITEISSPVPKAEGLSWPQISDGRELVNISKKILEHAWY